MNATAQEKSLSRLAAQLAYRIEQDAAELAKLAEGLSGAEWRSPGSLAATDRRPIGVIVHHVATVYPIEVDLARAIAAGNAVTEVTWEVVAGLNAKHAADTVNATKAETLELLRR